MIAKYLLVWFLLATAALVVLIEQLEDDADLGLGVPSLNQVNAELP
ncbi:MAG: hypothetical protein OEY74_01390 [Gammaproteobacteria bacterium]|nr:hypothetical protein [Gammaproteobacteria bacterium]